MTKIPLEQVTAQYHAICMQAVQASTIAFVQGLTEAELSRTVSVFGREQQVIDLIATVITHGSSHAGEITTLRALMNALSS